MTTNQSTATLPAATDATAPAISDAALPVTSAGVSNLAPLAPVSSAAISGNQLSQSLTSMNPMNPISGVSGMLMPFSSPRYTPTVNMLSPQMTAPPQSTQAGPLMAASMMPPASSFSWSSFAGLVTVKLSHDNHLLWKAQVLPVLRGAHWMGLADGTEAMPSQMVVGIDGVTPTVNPAYFSWLSCDQNCLSFLLSTLSPDTLRLVLFQSTAAAVWGTLERKFATHSRARVMQLRRQLATLQKREMTMVEYFNKVKGLTDALSAAGKDLDEEDFIIYLLTGLDNSYDALVTSVTTRTEPMSVNDLYSHLLDYELRHDVNQAHFPGAGSSVHNVSRGGGGGYRGRRGGGRGGGGRGGGQSGNQSGGGRGGGEQRGNQGGGSGKPRITCQLCKKDGHEVLTCRRRFDHSFTQPEGGHSVNNTTVDPAWLQRPLAKMIAHDDRILLLIPMICLPMLVQFPHLDLARVHVAWIPQEACPSNCRPVVLI
uniref:Uncharacterized protein n=1 Tax=Avena sativa TaxID=4498 RepID=A0ACD6AQE6_AVESA